MVKKTQHSDPAGLHDEADRPGDDPGTDAGATAAADQAADLRKERDGLQDRLLRQAAEFDNYRKRVDRERRESTQYAAIEFVQELLPIVDDFERALRTDAAGAESYRQGIEIIHRSLMDMLRKRGVTPIDAVGADFDPQVHQAVSYEDAAGRRDGEVLEEFRRGYKLGDRLVRPAMVKVAKA